MEQLPYESRRYKGLVESSMEQRRAVLLELKGSAGRKERCVSL